MDISLRSISNCHQTFEHQFVAECGQLYDDVYENIIMRCKSYFDINENQCVYLTTTIRNVQIDIDDSTDFMNALARVQDGGMFHIYLKISQDDLNTTSSPNKKRRLNNNNPQNVFNESSNVSVYHKPSSNPPTKTPTKTPTTPTHPYSYYHSPYPYYEPYTSPPQTHAHLPPHEHTYGPPQYTHGPPPPHQYNQSPYGPPQPHGHTHG
eukprot:70673_1